MKRIVILFGLWLVAWSPPLAVLLLSGCGQSDSVQEVGYRPLSLGNHAKTGDQPITPPSSGTSNGTGSAIPRPAASAPHPS